VIVAFPSFKAVTLPFSSTVAIDSSLEDQVTDLSVASCGKTVAVKVSDSPTPIIVEFLFNLTLST
jgi:hypothetical protein